MNGHDITLDRDTDAGVAWVCSRCGLRVLFRKRTPEQMAGFTYRATGTILADAAQGCGIERARELASNNLMCLECDVELVDSVMRA